LSFSGSFSSFHGPGAVSAFYRPGAISSLHGSGTVSAFSGTTTSWSLISDWVVVVVVLVVMVIHVSSFPGLSRRRVLRLHILIIQFVVMTTIITVAVVVSLVSGGTGTAVVIGPLSRRHDDMLFGP
jgi:hypothetical protein